MYLENILTIILILLISMINKISNKNKFRLKLVTDGILNKILIIGLIFILFADNFLLGMLSIILLHTIMTFDINDIKEGFQCYCKKELL
jgi:hypothetical protein